MGNDVAALKSPSERTLASAKGLFDPDGYPVVSSDIAAHLVFAHQTGMTNLLTRASYEARAADPLLHPPFASTPEEDERVASMMAGVAREVVDYLLFIDETKLSGQIRGSSGFAERFSASGPRDRKGRSLYALDLNRRLMKYPCSYMIYSKQFDGLPSVAKDVVYRRMWEILSGQVRDKNYARLSLGDRTAIDDGAVDDAIRGDRLDADSGDSVSLAGGLEFDGLNRARPDVESDQIFLAAEQHVALSPEPTSWQLQYQLVRSSQSTQNRP